MKKIRTNKTHRIIALSLLITAAAVILVFVFTIFWPKGSMSTTQFDVTHFRDREKVRIELAGTEYLVEVVTTPESTAQGLSGRTEIGADGMLFVFAESSNRFFWMKGMKFAIDMVWIEQGKVVGYTQNVPPPSPGTHPGLLEIYPSTGAVNLVLELPAGTVAQNKIEKGATLLVTPE